MSRATDELRTEIAAELARALDPVVKRYGIAYVLGFGVPDSERPGAFATTTISTLKPAGVLSLLEHLTLQTRAEVDNMIPLRVTVPKPTP